MDVQTPCTKGGDRSVIDARAPGGPALSTRRATAESIGLDSNQRARPGDALVIVRASDGASPCLSQGLFLLESAANTISCLGALVMKPGVEMYLGVVFIGNGKMRTEAVVRKEEVQTRRS